VTITDSTPIPVEITTFDLFDEWRNAGLRLETYQRVLARMDTDASYRAEIAHQWLTDNGAGGESENSLIDELREWIGCRIQMIEEAWPILLPAVLSAKGGKLVDADPELWADTGARFMCPSCPGRTMYIRFTISSNRDKSLFRNVELSHTDDSICKILFGEVEGMENSLECLGLGGLMDDPTLLGLSFLDEDASVHEDTTDWLVPGMFARGDYWSLFGPSEVGKSLLVLDWSLQMARRGERVLYLDRENSREVLGQRLRKMGAKREDFVNLLLMPFVDIKDLATEAGAKELHAMVKKHKATVVVLDTISKFSEVGQAVQSDRWQKMYNHSFVPLLKAGVSVGQLDHTGLGDKSRERDSNAKRDNVSVAWALTWRGKDRLTLTRAKNRPNYSSPGSVAVERLDEPILTHTFGQSVPDDIRKALEELERLNLPARAGRPAARAALDAAGVSMADKVLEQAIRIRKGA
jgi:hypothetical protein